MIHFNMKGLFSGKTPHLQPGQETAVEHKIRVDLKHLPLRIRVGDGCLDIFADCSEVWLGEEPALMVVGDDFFQEIHGFLRLEPRSETVLGRSGDLKALIPLPKGMASRHLILRHKGDSLVVKNLQTHKPLLLTSTGKAGEANLLVENRQRNLHRVRHIFGGPFRAMSQIEALNDLEEVNRNLAEGVYRPKTNSGEPGALLELPDHLNPIILGDLHGHFENLLKVLSSGRYLDALEEGSAYLLLLGDLIHPEVGPMDDMRGSVLTMDILCKLMLRFPNRVFSLLGNHDSFSPHIRKDGVQQGLVWEEWVRRFRGETYLRALIRFYNLLPLAAVSGDFTACHGGPPRMRVDRQAIIHARSNTNLVHELLHNRITRPHHLIGYTRYDVKQFVKALGGGKALIVGHNPLSDEETLWLNAGKINNHHIIYGSREDCVPLFTRTATGELTPLIYSGETLTAGLSPWPQAPDPETSQPE